MVELTHKPGISPAEYLEGEKTPSMLEHREELPMLSYHDDGWLDEDGHYHPADLPDPDQLDWGDDFDDLDSAGWEDYLGGPDDDVFEALAEPFPHCD